MASDPFGTAPEQAEGPFFTFSLKPSGSYDASMTQVRGTIDEIARLLKVERKPGATDFDLYWQVQLRWNDLARAVQADESKKAASAGKA